MVAYQLNELRSKLASTFPQLSSKDIDNAVTEIKAFILAGEMLESCLWVSNDAEKGFLWATDKRLIFIGIRNYGWFFIREHVKKDVAYQNIVSIEQSESSLGFVPPALRKRNITIQTSKGFLSYSAPRSICSEEVFENFLNIVRTKTIK